MAGMSVTTRAELPGRTVNEPERRGTGAKHSTKPYNAFQHRNRGTVPVAERRRGRPDPEYGDRDRRPDGPL
jgi:hypothetical protein